LFSSDHPPTDIKTNLQVLQRNLEFFSRALGTAAFRRIMREALGKLNNMLWSDVLMGQNFTSLGAAQFVRDVDAVCSLVERHIRAGSSALGPLSDALHLLNLPLQAEEGGMTLKQASDMVFTSNTEAKKLLDLVGLGTDSLSPANARQILQRRVENSE